LTIPGLFVGFLWLVASNDSKVVNDGNFGDLGGYFFGNLEIRPTILPNIAGL